MARLFFTLALAHSAVALLKDVVYVEVVREDHVRISPNIVGDLAVGAAVDEEEGLLACATADAVINSCYSAGALETSAPDAVFEGCVCCESGNPVVSAYSNCAEYISDSVSGREASTIYSAVSILYDVCSSAGRGVCAGGGATATGRPTATRTSSSSGGDITAPAACTSMMSIYSSCSMDIDFSTARVSEIAECFCNDRSGRFNTRFEDYARSCAPFVRTAVPEDYEAVSSFQDICDEVATTGTSRLSLSTVSSRNPGAADLPGFSLPTGTTESTSSSGTPNPTSTNRPTAGGQGQSTNLAAPGSAAPGFVTWIANLTTFILSFFVLI